MTPTPKLSMQKQIRKKREQKPRSYHPALRRTRAAEHLPTHCHLRFLHPGWLCGTERSRPIFSCAVEESLLLSPVCVAPAPGIIPFARSVTPAAVTVAASSHLFHGTLSRLVQALSGEFLSQPALRLQTKNCVTGWTSQTVERQQLTSAPVKAQSSLVFKCTLSTISCPTTLTCRPCREFTRANVHFASRV